MEETEVSGENQRSATSHWQTSLHKVVLSTSRNQIKILTKRLKLKAQPLCLSTVVFINCSEITI